MTYLYILILAFAHLAAPAEHDIHVSVGDVEVRADGIELVVKTYLDDIQKAMGLEPGAELPENYTSAEAMISDYINSRIRIQYDGLPMSLLMDDVSASMDAVWITLKSKEKLKSLPKKIDLHYELLTEVYSDQTNVITIKWPEGKDSALLNAKKTVLSVQIR